MVEDLHERPDEGQGVGRRLDGVMSAHDDRTALPEGLVRLSDSDIEATPGDGPPDVARSIALVGRVTLLHARE